ncbi:Reticulon-like protein B22 [Cucurbita argyrosperma subsp. argyrosperma]|nr:Reticulon-like protein B22 [Cucurbita argyrosperma subsp. argyrosperma]
MNQIEGRSESLKDAEMANRSISCKTEVGKPLVALICGSLVYYHCAYRNSSLLSLVADVFIVLLCSLAILGLLFRHMNVSVPVDPLEWQISQDTANSMIAWLANTIGAAESVLRVAATGHDKRLFVKVFLFSSICTLARFYSDLISLTCTLVCFFTVLVLRGMVNPLYSIHVIVSLYALSVLGRLVSGVTVAYTGLCMLCIYMVLENSESISAFISPFLRRGNDPISHQDSI